MKLKTAGLILIIASSISVLRTMYYQFIYFSSDLNGISIVQEFFNFILSLFTPIALILVGIALYGFKEKKDDNQYPL